MNSRDYLVTLFLALMLVFLVFDATATEDLNQDVLFFSEDFSGEDVSRSSAGEWFGSMRLPEPEEEALQFSDRYVLRGEQSMRLHAENPDNDGWDYSDVNSYRTEVGTHSERWSMWNNEPPFNVVGEPIWFSFSVYIPEDWEYHLDDGSTETINIAEFHANGLPDKMYEEPFVSAHGKPWVMSIWDDEFTFTNGYLSRESGTDIERTEIERAHADIQRGEWNDVVVNVKWADGDDSFDGFMDIWVNDEQVYDYEGPTLLNSDEPPRPLKLSIYNSQWDGSDSYVEERTLYFDDVRFGWANASYEDMDPGPTSTQGDSQDTLSVDLGAHESGWATLALPIDGEVPLSQITDDCDMGENVAYGYEGEGTSSETVDGMRGYAIQLESDCTAEIETSSITGNLQKSLPNDEWTVFSVPSDTTVEDLESGCDFNGYEGTNIFEITIDEGNIPLESGDTLEGSGVYWIRAQGEGCELDLNN